ncbi:MAG: Ig-like domain-containing protein [Ancrocorticia sp.]
MSVVKQPRVSRVSSVVTTLCAIALCLGALISPGMSTPEVKMNDGGVWVTNSKLRLVAHLNYPSRLLDSGLRAESDVFDVAQHGEEVFVNDFSSAGLSRVDVAHTVLEDTADFDGYSTVVNGETLVVTDTRGSVWVLPAASYADFTPTDHEPVVTDVPGAVVAVGLDGSVHVASARTATVTTIVPGRTRNTVTTHALDGVTEGATLQVAAVGSRAVVLDTEKSTLYYGDRQRLDLKETALDSAEGMKLQESGPERDTILLASTRGLLTVPVSGGDVHTTSHEGKSGTPSRPVLHRGCAYGAWAGAGTFVRDCDDEAADVVMKVDTLRSVEQAIFRTNRDVIVLNDIASGGLWLPDEQMIMVDNWDQVNSDVQSDRESDEEIVEEIKLPMLPERNEKNTDPVAVNDEFGVRAGRRTILPVLLNDSDVDGDFVTATPLSQPSIGSVTVARDGAALEITVKEGKTGSSTFEYEVSDGRGGVAQAKVKVSIHGDEVNSPPVQLTKRVVSFGVGKKASTNALTSWYDPDGDPFYLQHVVPPTGIDSRSHEDGTLELLEKGHGPGSDEITLVVSDGRDISEGSMSLTVKEGDNEPPLPNTDFVRVQAGLVATVSPLDNDSDPDGDPLRLTEIEHAPAGIIASMDETTGEVTIEGREEGTFYLGYRVTDGPNVATSVIRVDVLEATDLLPPSAESDLGVLPDGGVVVVDLLSNDTDPMGGVLTVQSVDVSMDSPLVAALIDHQIVRISAPEGLTDPEAFSYSVSNGFESTTATVTVLPTQPAMENLSPELTDDTLVVRTGDVGNASVLANDRHPTGLKMTVRDELRQDMPEDVASAFISNNVIRVRGGSRGGSGSIEYTVHDSMGNTSSAVLRVTVVESDPERNDAPRPKQLTARTTAGKPIDIRIPREGVDPDGDSVYVIGPGSLPTLGSVEIDGTVATYTPSASARGTDTFSYVVEDRLGKQAMGQIRVGIVPPSEMNQNPVAFPDHVRARPGAKVSVAVCANDSDPDGDKIHLNDKRIVPAEGIKASANSCRVELQAPSEEGSYDIVYGIEDRAGGSAEGLLTVVVSEDAPLLAPIARNDDVPLADVRAATGDTVNVQVLRNDEDPDGDIAGLIVTSPDPEVSPALDGTVDVKLAPENQILLYTVRDADGLEASAVIRVPGTDAQRPMLNNATLPIKVKAGEPTDILINDHLVAREGRTVSIVAGAKVSVGAGDVGDGVVKDATTFTYTAPKDFSGMTAVSLEVTDGEDSTDRLTGAVILPILVEAAGNHPPEFISTTIEAVVGESTSVDLRPMVKDPDEGDAKKARLSLKGTSLEGIGVSLRGSILEVSAVKDSLRGNAGSIKITIDDGKGGVIDAGIPVIVVSSSRPLIQTSEAQVTLDAGETRSIDVTAYSKNPFPDEGGMSIVEQPIVSAGGSATAMGTVIDVKANEKFSGKFTVTYRLADATGDSSREVDGSIVVTVRGKPSAPKNVTATSNEPGKVRVSWIPGTRNGAPITNFTVHDHTQGDSVDCGKVTSCLLEGRTSGVEHIFSVTATNEVGESQESTTATTMIKAEPETPQAPNFVWVTWRGWNPADLTHQFFSKEQHVHREKELPLVRHRFRAPDSQYWQSYIG